MSILLLLYGIETPEADAVIPPVVPPVIVIVAEHISGGGVGFGKAGGVKKRKRKRALAFEREHMTTPEWLLAEDEDVMVILQ